ncbi:MAG: efflux RND transporter periplasmic adaptor subunit [Sediminibacterium sp.]|nr:efflux RND transporter periplasmic adaptor subunit [uncultured Sediminibacterium sp.]
MYPLLLAGFFVISCKSKKEEPRQQNSGPQSVIVDVIIAGKNNISNIVEVNGSVVANESTNLQPEVSGRLTYLNIPEGAKVTEGTVLARINDADLQASTQKVKVQLELAQKNEERLRKLLSIGGINQADYDAVLNQVNTFKADLDILKAQIDKTVLKAPFTGVLGLRMVSPGTYVTPATVLATLQQTDRVKIDFTIPEAYTDLIGKGKTVNIKTTGKDVLKKAVIIATEPQIDATTRNLKVRAQLDGANINPGGFVKVLLETGGQNNSILVPTNAIIPDAKAKKVVVVKNGKGKLTDIVTGLRVNGLAEVLSGLQVGDSIAVSGVLFVRPNSSLKVRSVKQIEEFAGNQP